MPLCRLCVCGSVSMRVGLRFFWSRWLQQRWCPMQIGGRLADSRGARNVALPASVLLVAWVASLAFAPTLPTALAAAALTGLGNGAMDVSMNALGVRVEQAR